MLSKRESINDVDEEAKQESTIVNLPAEDQQVEEDGLYSEEDEYQYDQLTQGHLD